MNSRRGDGPPTVHVPAASEDRPSWVKVGIIAAVGFGVGVVWPRLAGVRLGPNAPAESAAVASASGSRSPDAPLPGAIPAAPLAASGGGVGGSVGGSVALRGSGGEPAGVVATEAADTGKPQVTLGKIAVLSCKGEGGETLKGAAACGTMPAFDALAIPRLRRLAQCPTADGTTGKLAVVLGTDFVNNRVTVSVGKSSTVDNQDTLAGCLMSAFQNVSLGAVAHEHPRYSLLYNVQFSPRATVGAGAGAGTATAASSALSPSPGATAAPAKIEAGGAAEVMWEVAILRDAPRTGQVIGRLQRGTKLRVEHGPEGGWYRVRYGAGFTTEGWIYRGSIGR